MTTSTPASRRRVTFLGDALCESALLQAHATTCDHDFRPVFAQSCGVDFVVGNHEHTIHGGDFSHLGEGKLTTYCLGDLSSCTGLWVAVPQGFAPRAVTFSIAWHIDLERALGGAARVAGSSFGVLARRKGESEGKVTVHPAAELWRALPAGAERDALARDIREAASIFAGRSFADAPIADEFPLQKIAPSFGVESMMQYDFQDDGPRRDYTEHNFGMTFQNLTPKPSFAAEAFMTLTWTGPRVEGWYGR